MQNTGNKPSGILQGKKEKGEKKTAGRDNHWLSTVTEKKDAKVRSEKAVQAIDS